MERNAPVCTVHKALSDIQIIIDMSLITLLVLSAMVMTSPFGHPDRFLESIVKVGDIVDHLGFVGPVEVYYDMMKYHTL
jgi:hypothetical protein